jgi:hypothetical protein
MQPSMQQLMRTVSRAVAGLVAAVLLLYVGDAVVLRMRMPAGLDTIPVQPYYAIPQKDGKTEFVLADPATRTCTRSLFPQLGYNPCWYVRRHLQLQINE